MNKQELMRLTLASAQAALRTGAHRTAVFEATLALALADTLGEALAAAEAATLLTRHLAILGRHDEALRHGRRALQGWRALGRLEPQCDMLSLLASCATEHGQQVEALGFARAAFDLAHAHGMATSLVHGLIMLGAAHGRLDDWEAGEAMMMQALSRAREQRDDGAVARAMNSLIVLLVEAHSVQLRGDDPELPAATARRLLQHGRQALALCTGTTDGYRRTVMRCNAAAALMASGWHEDALALLRGCVQLASEAGFTPIELKARRRIAQCLLALGQDGAAAAEVQTVLGARRSVQQSMARIECAELMARLADRSGDAAAAAAQQATVADLDRQRREQGAMLGEVLRRNAEDVHAALGRIDGEWFDSKHPPRS